MIRCMRLWCWYSLCLTMYLSVFAKPASGGAVVFSCFNTITTLLQTGNSGERMWLLTKCRKVESYIECDTAAQMCEAKVMSPSCDDRIISSGSSDAVCLLNFCSYKTFFSTAAAEHSLPCAALFIFIF